MIITYSLKPIAVILALNTTNHDTFVSSDEKFNEVNPQYQVDYSTSIDNFVVSQGVYLNSYSKAGMYMGVTYTPVPFAGGGISASAFLTTGYEHVTGLDLTPFYKVGVSARYNFKDSKWDSREGVGVSAFLFPRDTQLRVGTGFGIDYKINLSEKTSVKEKTREDYIRDMQTRGW